MTRRKVKRAPVRTVSWVPELASLFSLVSDDWTPPDRVKVHQAKAHTTLSARFRTPAGHVSTAVVRISRASSSEVWIHDEKLSFTFKIGGAA